MRVETLSTPNIATKMKRFFPLTVAVFALLSSSSFGAFIMIDWIDEGTGTVPGTAVTYTLTTFNENPMNWPGDTVSGAGNTYSWSSTDPLQEVTTAVTGATLTFSAPLPVEKLALALGEVHSGFGKVFLSGGTASPSDFTLINDDLGTGHAPFARLDDIPNNAIQLNRTVPPNAEHSYGFLVSNSADTVTKVEFQRSFLSPTDDQQWAIGFTTVIPEPSSTLLAGMGAFFLLGRRRRRS